MKTSNTGSPSASHQRMDESHSTIADSAWKPLYRVGAAAALIVVVLFLIEIIGFIAWGTAPSTTIGWFTLFQNNRLRGLFDLFLLDVVYLAFFVPLFLALYAALRRASQSFMAIALTLGLVGIAVYFASNPAFEMLSLSNQYAAATTDAQRSLIEASGLAMLAVVNGTGFYMAFILVSLAGLIISAVMLRSNIFSKVTASVGILANALSLADYFRLAFVPAAGAILLIISGVLLVIWLILIARRLFMLAQSVSNEEAKQPA
jgi:hypothetical protein